MSVGDALLDSQHQQLVDLLNTFSDLMTPSDVSRAIVTMRRYADRHFKDEEQALARVGYPQLEKQRCEHQVFMLKAAEFSDQNTDCISVQIQLATYLSRWLLHHIQTEDMKFKPYLLGNAHGPSTENVREAPGETGVAHPRGRA